MGKNLLALLLVGFLAGILVLVILAPQSHIQPQPRLVLGPAPQPVNAPDFKAIEDITTRKQAFFDFLRPLIARQNAFYAQERRRLQEILNALEAGKPLSRSARRKLVYWRKKLKVPADLPLQEQLEVLELRLAGLPPAMVLAQAASESAWGKSRFAREANNYFGQWCYRRGCGMVPRRRNEGAAHEVRSFASPEDSVQAYFRNINTHRAYRDLRKKRLALQRAGEEVTALALIEELGRYSERGQHYVDELSQLIRGNDLE